jgi:RES domain-containing protein
MIVYRLSKSKYSNDLSGKGAERSGGRWNSKGVAMIYTGASRALCTAEIAVHTPLGNIPTDYDIISFDIPDAFIRELDVTTLPENWRSFSQLPFTRETGDKFVSDNIYLILKVPSAVVPGDFNFLMNPHHQYFSKVKIVAIEKFAFDERLFV